MPGPEHVSLWRFHADWACLVLVASGWGLDTPTAGPPDLLEVLDARDEHGSAIITYQFPTERWHENLGERLRRKGKELTGAEAGGS